MYPSASWPLSSRTRNIRLRKASMTSPSTSSFSSFAFIGAPCLGGFERAVAASAATARSRLRDSDDVASLGALLTLGGFELDTSTFRQALEAVAGDVREVDEQVLRTLVRGDEAIPLAVVEPLHGSGCHRNTSLHELTNKQEGARANPDSLWF